MKISGTDTDSMIPMTSGGLTFSLTSAIFTNAGSTTTITSGGLTKGNTLALSGTVSNVIARFGFTMVRPSWVRRLSAWRDRAAGVS